MRYELGFYISEDILHSHRRENLKPYIVCKISGFHGGDYEEWCILGCYAVWLL
jgi:hypothetical protein